MGSTTMNDYFECTCSSKEHTFCVTSEQSKDEYPPELFFHFQLIHLGNFLERFKTAVKYLFGYKCRYGHWDVINLSEDDTNRLTILLHQHRARLNKFHAEMEKKNDRTN
jgi:hypothetical protein